MAPKVPNVLLNFRQRHFLTLSLNRPQMLAAALDQNYDNGSDLRPLLDPVDHKDMGKIMCSMHVIQKLKSLCLHSRTTDVMFQNKEVNFM